MPRADRRRGLTATCALTCAVFALLLSGAAPLPSGAAALLPSGAAAPPFRGGEYRVFGTDWETILFTFRTSRDLRWVTSNPTPQYYYENCRAGGRRVSLWMVFELRQRMRLTRDGRFSRLDEWPRVTGRFSSDGSKISVRLQNRAFSARGRTGPVRCPALDRRFEALVYLPAGDYAGSTAQGHPISFTLGGPGRKLVSNLGFGADLPCEPAGSVTHTYSGLSGRVDVSGFPVLQLSTGSEPYGGGTRRASVRAEWLGATVSGHVSASWLPPEPDFEDDSSPFACETTDLGIPFTARLARRAPGT